MMKTKFILMAVIVFALASCEKVIFIDLNTTNPKLIIEANITNQPGPQTVFLSHTVNYYDENIFPAVTGARIILSDNAGNLDSLHEVAPGNYQTNNLQGVEGRIYFLKIYTADGNEYTGTSTMPYRVAIDSINFEANRNGTSYRVICKFKDPQDTLNYYKLQLSANNLAGLDSTNIRIVADGFADGQELSLTYRTHLVLGDSAQVKLDCIDKPTYDFYRTLPDLEGGVRSFTSAPPANPLSNVNNGALGYFSAHWVTAVSTVVHL